MPARNIKALTREELEFLNNMYFITIEGNDIVVSTKVSKTLHNKNELFTLKTPIRKMSFTKEGIDMWSKYFKDQYYTLIDVQNMVNVLKITYQDVTPENVLNKLENGIQRIKTI